MRQFDTISPFAEVRDFEDDVQLLFDDLERCEPTRQPPTGVYAPGLDVVETEDAIEILIDVPGVGASSMRVLIKGAVVVIAGRKVPPDPADRADASFHLLERGFGRFARAIRLNSTCDSGRATATLVQGVLRVTIPKIPHREILVPIDVQPSS